MQPFKRLVIVAGEESGDVHAAHFVRQLKINHPSLSITGMGGQHMQEAGVELITDLTKFGSTGITEVIRNIRVIRRAFIDIKTHLTTHKPDLLVLVDFPGFNLRLAKFAKEKLGIRILYYISPQIWAWKARRIEVIRNCVDHMAVILPFEKAIYKNAGIPVTFTGHPLVAKLTRAMSSYLTRQSLGLPENKRIVAMLPGSRTNEIEKHMPVIRDTALCLSKQFDDIHFVIPVAGTLNLSAIHAYFENTNIPYSLVEGNALDTMICSDCVVVASGTASLESALLEKPMCIIYKASWITYLAASKLIRVKYLGLCNLLQNEMIVPELLQYDCNTTELTRMVISLLNDKEVISRMQTRLHQLKMSLSIHTADRTIGDLVELELGLSQV